jgi:hypothetical protein
LQRCLCYECNLLAGLEKSARHIFINREHHLCESFVLSTHFDCFLSDTIHEIGLGGVASILTPHFLEIHSANRHIKPEHGIDLLEGRCHNRDLVVVAAHGFVYQLVFDLSRCRSQVRANCIQAILCSPINWAGGVEGFVIRIFNLMNIYWVCGFLATWYPRILLLFGSLTVLQNYASIVPNLLTESHLDQNGG